MTTREVLKRAERVTIAHVYDDGTYLYDILVAGKAYVIRTHSEYLNQSNPQRGEK